jgi:hypothetical protein
LIAVAGEICIPRAIARRVGLLAVLTAVELNRNSIRMAGEVGKIRTNGRLSPEVRMTLPPSTQGAPQLALRVGHIASQPTGY